MVSYGSARGTRVERAIGASPHSSPLNPRDCGGSRCFGACYCKANLAAVAAGPNVT